MAYDPIIAPLPNATQLAQAVVRPTGVMSAINVLPQITQIGDVRTITVSGTAGGGGFFGGGGGGNTIAAGIAQATIQLPTRNIQTVQTTVSVPDGGTILLGGLKQHAEGRNEFGTPVLSKLPYLNRLFKNSASARFSNSLMLLVTPRIIIQAEEEEMLGTPPEYIGSQ